MRRLSPKDVRWLDIENDRRPMHTLKVAVVTPPAGAGHAEVRDTIEERIGRVPTLRWRLAFGPGGFGRPGWVEDPDFDVDRQLILERVAARGGHRELCDVVARAAEAPLLDRSRPLWQLWIVDGLADGRMAVITRVHHAAADGVSFARVLASWFAPDPMPSPAPPGAEPGPVGHLAGMLTVGLRDKIVATAAFLSASRRAKRPPAPDVPAAPFNGRALSPDRRFACQALPLEQIHRARKPLEATVNDVLIALMADALREYLLDRNALPDDPLVATMPVSLLSADQHEPIGNRGLTGTILRLPTDIADPIERIHAAQVNARAAKDELANTVGARIDDAVDLLPRPGVRSVARALDSARGTRLGNLTLSNVRGPTEPLAADGFTVDDFFSVGPCTPSIGLNVTAWSYADRFNVSLLVDSDAIPDPWEIAERLPGALDRVEASIAAPAS